ncbi:hypothetical protein GCM10027403_04500 [Arthrobacter tecti]
MTSDTMSQHSQTLSRGLRALEILADSPNALSIADVAAELGVHRSIAYRIVRTLEDHSLVVRDGAGRVSSGPGLAALARGVSRDLQAAALPELTALANELGMTAFIAVWDKHDCVTLVTVEPRDSTAAVAQRPGSRHAFSAGAPGIAIQSAVSEEEWQRLAPAQPYREESRLARNTGFATSHDEVIAGLSSVAAPVLLPGRLPAAVAVVYIRSAHPPAELGARIANSARTIENQLS